MSRMIVSIEPSHFSDAEVGGVLEHAVRAILHAEAELREAKARFDRVVASARRNGQDRFAEEAFRNLFDRRARALE
jgi:hypothetical protein